MRFNAGIIRLPKTAAYVTILTVCERGEIGRRAGFRIRWASRAGSSPVARTISAVRSNFRLRRVAVKKFAVMLFEESGYAEFYEKRYRNVVS